MKFYRELHLKKIFCEQAISKLQDLKFWAAREFLWFQKNEKVVEKLNNERLAKTNEKMKEVMVKMIGRCFGMISKFQEFYMELNQIEKKYNNKIVNDKKYERELQFVVEHINKEDALLHARMKDTLDKYQSLVSRKETFNKKIAIAKRIKDFNQKNKVK